MSQIFTIALIALKSINEVLLGTGPNVENPHLTQAKLSYYSYML